MWNLIPLPYRIAGIAVFFSAVVLSVVGYGVYEHKRGYSDATKVLQPKIDILTAVVQSDELTIKQMEADAKQNDELLAQYSDAVDLLTKKAFDDLNAIRELEKNDKSVSAYLNTPVPDGLRSLLNNGAASAGGVQNGARPPAKGTSAALPGSPAE